MNGKRNRCILKLMLMLGVLLPAQHLRSQDIYDWEAWRGGRNIAGLASASSPRKGAEGPVMSSGAEFNAGVETGGFRSFSDAPTLWRGGVSAETEVHHKDMLFAGSFSFDLSGGEDMCGSMFTHPGYYPFDVMEFTPGAKMLQNYGLYGGLAWKNGSRFIPGFTFRFDGSNYSKRKDLRHTTYRQEIEMVPSFIWDGDGFVLGAAVILSKDSESIQAEQIGSATAESYYAFLDKGLMYGTMQVWDGNGVHLSENGVDRFPVRQYSYGLALQAEIASTLYAEVEYLRSAGEVGEKGYTWFRFPGSSMSSRLSWTMHRPSGVHVFKVSGEWFRQQTFESVIDRVTSGGVTTPVEYGSNRIFERRSIMASPAYDFYASGGAELHASAKYIVERERSTVMFPFFHLDGVSLLRLNVDGMLPLGRFELDGGLFAGCKIGEHIHMDDVEKEDFGILREPFRMEELFEQQSELDDLTIAGLSAGLRYNIPVAGECTLYARLQYSLVHAFGVQLLPGSERHVAQISFGYDF